MKIFPLGYEIVNNLLNPKFLPSPITTESFDRYALSSLYLQDWGGGGDCLFYVIGGALALGTLPKGSRHSKEIKKWTSVLNYARSKGASEDGEKLIMSLIRDTLVNGITDSVTDILLQPSGNRDYVVIENTNVTTLPEDTVFPVTWGEALDRIKVLAREKPDENLPSSFEEVSKQDPDTLVSLKDLRKDVLNSRLDPWESKAIKKKLIQAGLAASNLLPSDFLLESFREKFKLNVDKHKPRAGSPRWGEEFEMHILTKAFDGDIGFIVVLPGAAGVDVSVIGMEWEKKSLPAKAYIVIYNVPDSRGLKGDHYQLIVQRKGEGFQTIFPLEELALSEEQLLGVVPLTSIGQLFTFSALRGFRTGGEISDPPFLLLNFDCVEMRDITYPMKKLNFGRKLRPRSHHSLLKIDKSSVHGWGVFGKRSFPKNYSFGTILTETKNRAKVHKGWPNYLNHCVEGANTKLVGPQLKKNRRSYKLVSTRFIPEGQEILVNYWETPDTIKKPGKNFVSC